MFQIGTHEIISYSLAGEFPRTEAGAIYTEVVHKILVASSDMLSLLFVLSISTPFLNIEKAVNRRD